jgi:hypothetical protein
MEPSARHRELVALAELIELDSRHGRALAGPLGLLDEALGAATAGSRALSPAAASAAARLRDIVAQLARDVGGGHVRSISGLAAHARNLVAELDRDEAGRSARGYVLT